MSDLTNRAIAKLTGECEKKEYLIPFEEYLTGIMTDKVAEKVLEEKKSLQGAFDNMKKIARARAKNGCAYIPPEEGFRIIRDYYKIEKEEKESVIDITDLL